MIKKIERIPVDLQFEIFNRVFACLIQFPTYREIFLDMIEAREEYDMAEVELKLIELAIELNQQKEGNDG